MHCPPSLVFVFLSLASGVGFAQGVRITPTWVAENPGRLMLTSGSGFGGQTHYTGVLKVEPKSQYEVWTKIRFNGEGNELSPWITTKCRITAPTDSIRFGNASYGIYSSTAIGDGLKALKADVVYEIYKVTSTDRADKSTQWKRELSFVLDQKNWTSLEIALAKQQQRKP